MLKKLILGALICLVFSLLGCSNPYADFVPVHFESGTTHIVPQDQVLLEANLQEMADFPDVNVELIGHTNSEGPDSANMVLSIARADTVYNWLVDNGISASRLTTSGRGEAEPVATNTTEEGRALNDRVEFVINRQ